MTDREKGEAAAEALTWEASEQIAHEIAHLCDDEGREDEWKIAWLAFEHHFREKAIAALDDAFSRGRKAALLEAAKVADAYKHIIYDTDADALSGVGRYSNATVERIKRAIRALAAEDGEKA